MSKGLRMGDLPIDVVSKISTYLLDEPKHLRLKNNNAFKQIQKKFKPRYDGLTTDMDYNGDNIIESICFEIEPKVKSFYYVMDLILKQTEYIQNLINQSHLMYLQPDMEKCLVFYMECDYEKKSYDLDRILQKKFNTDQIGSYQIETNDIEEALGELYEMMFDTICNDCSEEYDIVRLTKLYFTIDICIETDN